MGAAQLDIAAYKRVPFNDNVAIIGPDLSGAAYAMQIRQHWGDTGTALLTPSLTPTYDPAYVYYDPRRKQTIGPVPATIVAIAIPEADIEGLPFAADEEKPLELVYDMHITPSGETKRVALAGAFTIYPGSTI